jgi:beta-galactosidase
MLLPPFFPCLRPLAPRPFTALRLLPLFAVAATSAIAAPPTSPRPRENFDSGWRFHLGDPGWFEPQVDYPVIRSWMLATANPMLAVDSPHHARPETGNPGGDIPFARPAFDDSAWREVTLPHDWGIEGPFQQDLPGNTGKLPWAGIGWYRKTFDLPASDAGRLLTLEVDGAMAYSSFWLNGHYVGGWAYGYSSFTLDLTPYAQPGGRNVLAVRLDNPPDSSRWYPGAGLYRHVWLTRTGPVHIEHWSTAITTPRLDADHWLVSVAREIRNSTPDPVEARVVTTVYRAGPDGAPTGDVLARRETAQRLAPLRNNAFTHHLTLTDPALWAPGHPALHVAVTEVYAGDRLLDRVATRCGIREIRWTASRGVEVNGHPVPLRGVCMHHDLGALGTAVNRRALQRQIAILQAMGVNALRTSHNPPAPELLDLCDEMGMLVLDEAFDTWRKGKTRHDYHQIFADWHEPDLRALIRRDRNHPSVFAWSIGNEVMEQWGDDGQEGWYLTNRLAGIVREEDRSRPVTGGFNGEQCAYNGHERPLDAFGLNYKPHAYAPLHAAAPLLPVFGSETASTVSSRGEYFFPVSNDKLDPAARTDFQVSSYDLSATQWATTPEEEWRGQDHAGFPVGEFVWTGFDYLGEPTPYNSDATNLLNFSSAADRQAMAAQLERLGRIPVPSRSSYFGIVDLAGFPKDRFFLYQSRWRPDLPMAHILPHWTWPERVRAVTPVHVYTSGDEAELFLNGRSLGRKHKAPGEYRLRWDDVRYEPGELKVVAYRDGKPWADATMKTAGAPARLDLSAQWFTGDTADRTTLAADGRDLAFVSVAIADATGTLAPRANNLVRFTLSGPGEIVATDNGDATSFESFQAPQHHAFNGRVLAIIRTKAGQPGKLTLRAESDGLAPAEISFASRQP